MFIGIIVLFAAIIIGFMGEGGSLLTLWQPFEFITIIGSAGGAFLIANAKDVKISALNGVKSLLKGYRFKRREYMDLLSMLYSSLKLIKSKGTLAIESHIDSPNESALFKNFPLFLNSPRAVTFFCDYIRVLTIGVDDAMELEEMMDFEIEKILHEKDKGAHALSSVSDGLPAFGIVAAVLGVINTMGSISQPPEILGVMIGSALAGTFFGILFSYGIFGPIANGILNVNKHDIAYFECIKIAMISYLKGNDPSISVEFARKAISGSSKPDFNELSEALSALPSPV